MTQSKSGDPPASGPASLSGPAGGLSTKAASADDVVLKMVKDVDGMMARLPAARESKGPTDGELSALEEEVLS